MAGPRGPRCELLRSAAEGCGLGEPDDGPSVTPQRTRRKLVTFGNCRWLISLAMPAPRAHTGYASGDYSWKWTRLPAGWQGNRAPRPRRPECRVRPRQRSAATV